MKFHPRVRTKSTDVEIEQSWTCFFFFHCLCFSSVPLSVCFCIVPRLRMLASNTQKTVPTPETMSQLSWLQKKKSKKSTPKTNTTQHERRHDRQHQRREGEA
jgi:hypothetical protein